MRHNRFLFLGVGIFLFVLGSFFVFSRTFAQSIPGVSPSTDQVSIVSLEIDPATPVASDTVTATLVSYAINLDTYPIRWLLNGKEVSHAIGAKSFTFQMGALGSTASLRAEVDTPVSEYGTIVQEKKFSPANVDILWEADTYTPPFYKGKALPTSQSQIKMIATPSFFGKAAVVYNWEKESTSLGNMSGMGKNTLVFTGNYAYNTDNVRVIAETADGSLTAEKTENVSIATPKILFYQNKPLEGVRYEKELGTSFGITGNEVTVRAEPYFFSFPGRNHNSGSFVWTLDGKQLDNNPDDPSEFTLRSPNSGSGSVNLNLQITNTALYMQTDSKTVTLRYSHAL